HLFGPPAQDRKCETRIVFQRGGYKPEQWSEYTFTNDSNVSAPKGQPLGEQWTDANGQASFTFRYTPDDNITFPMRAMAVSDVFELGGRAVSGRASATFLPAKTLLGLTASSQQGESGFDVHVAAIDAEEAPAAIESVSVTLEREIWNYHVRRYRSHNQPRWEKSYQEVETQSVALQEGRGSTHFALNSQWGHYRVRVHSKETRHYSTLSFFTYGGGIQLRESATPELVKLEMDRPNYAIGDTARLRIESPFDGTAFVVLQGETIYDKIPVKIEGNTGMLEIPLKQEYYPNLWIECTMIHKVESGKSQAHPYSSFAVKNIELEDPKRELTVSFPDVPEEIRPETRHTFTVSVKDRNDAPVKAELTLAAIDEGIHAITGYKTPEPLAYFSRARRPDFRRAHYYDQVVYDFEKLRPGGDAALRMAEQVSTPLENWIQPVALWSGTVTTGEDGLAEVEMDIPDFNGQFRLVVVACTQNAVGAQDEHVYVRRPYMLRTSVPRFMLPGDAMNSTLVVFNQTETDCQATVRWNAQGALQAAEGKMDVTVPAKGEARVNAHFLAKEIIGQGTVEWKAAIYDREGQTLSQLSETLPLPVLPPAAYQSHHKLIVLEPGKQIELRQEGIRPDPRNRVELVVSANPVLRVQKALSYLIDYPYGCIEQTISRLMPLYLLKQNQELMKSVVPNTQIDEYLRAGIEKLFAMQTASGGLAYWPGSNSPHAYGSVYALHFLTLVKNSRQFEVSDDGFKALQGYVWGIAENWSQLSKSALFQRAYALYVLALGGDTRALNQIQRFDELLIPRASRYLLAAALALQTQDRERVDTYLATAPFEPYTQRELGGTFNSPMRNKAIELMSLRQIGGHKQRQAELANELIRFLETEGRGNTQETAFVVTALGGYLSDLAKNIAQTGCTIEGPASMEQLAGLDVYRDEHKGASAPYLVRNTGETNIYVSHAVHGVPIQPATQAVSEGMSVDRVFYLDGEEKQSRSYEQGETYVIRLTLHCEYDLENVIVADLLPAGFEVENPRLDPNAVPDMKMENAVHPSHLEIRDDRVVLAFNTLKKGRHSFYYIARAVTKGQYHHPPLNAECMYDPKIHAKTALAVIEVD
ncbi:hypothetical protein GF373_02335, partial [bacterium]|nr:hypothetical protein [bacterium]